jgi:hypothetical protein
MQPNFLRTISLLSVLAFTTVACSKTAPRRTLRRASPSSSVDSGIQNSTRDASGTDSGQSSMSDSGNTPFDAGQAPTDCSENPNRCVPNELISPAPECTCLNECEENWMWDPRTRTCIEACESQIVPSFSGTPCANSTLVCLQNCSTSNDPDCQDTCFENEPDQEGCFGCINQNFIACANRLSCQDEYDAFNCCVATNCPEDPDSCRDTTCGNFTVDYDDCLGQQSERCQADLIMCFQM